MTLSLKKYQGRLREWANKAGKIPRLMAYHAFLFILIGNVLAVLFGQLLFYNYVFLVKTQDPGSLVLPVTFKQATYQDVVQVWQLHQDASKAAASRSYPSPFN